ncbi:hypothetical protein D3C71_1449860 [compost metagenome]
MNVPPIRGWAFAATDLQVHSAERPAIVSHQCFQCLAVVFDASLFRYVTFGRGGQQGLPRVVDSLLTQRLRVNGQKCGQRFYDALGVLDKALPRLQVISHTFFFTSERGDLSCNGLVFFLLYVQDADMRIERTA